MSAAPTPARRGPAPANERLRRLLVILPWIMERGEVTVAEVAERFAMSEAAVIGDLERAAMCGVPPFGPDDLIDLFVDDGVVYAGPPRFFTRPLRLTAPEGFALLAAGRAALQLPGADPSGPLARALDKGAGVLGAAGVEVDLTPPSFADAIGAAVADHARLRVEYFSPAHEAASERIIDPLAVFTDRGYWYVIADDHRSGEQRTFRIDRFSSVQREGSTFHGRDVVPPTASGWFAEEDLPRATLHLAPTARFVAERYPVDSTTELADGTLEVVLPVTSEAALARLLVRAGAGATVVNPPQWRDLAARTARRVLARYAG